MLEQYPDWETIIGLEIHVELNTQSKLFSHAPNRFGDEPNTNISVVCTGQPGALPVLNKEAVRKATQLGCAVNAKVATWSKFDRKSYFYPDSPRNFQITQFEYPIVLGGSVVADVEGVPTTFELDRAHLEDDAGMLKHFSKFAGVDYNRAGVPLIEIVSTPCMHNPQEAVAYAKAVKAIMEYLDASDCNMEEGSLRMDVNISVRKKGETSLRNKIEIKNMNSFTFMHQAILHETERQIEEYLKHPQKDHDEIIPACTYRWDADLQKTVLMRRKETADDYRYFPEPDLPPLVLSQSYIDDIKNSLPEMPYQREKRYIKDLELSAYNANILVSEKKLADYFELGLKITKNAKSLCNWITVEFAGRLKDQGIPIWETNIKSENIAQLVTMIDSKEITGKIAKCVANDMIESPEKSCKDIVKENSDYQPVSDSSEIEKMVDQVLNENAQSIEDFHNGKTRAYKYLMGQVMKISKGKASPQIVNELLEKKLQAPSS
jgi:aspartyl-tRNA(Asn)/glutamyl-tRNA(Gln) amidotransferase subunit B